MINNDTGICIQIGLYTKAEYFFVTDADYTLSSRKLPEAITAPYTQWRYYGIDQDCGSIAFMIGKYDDIENAMWIQAAINRDSRLKKITSWKVRGRRKFYMKSTTLETLFSDLNLPRIDVLAMDIEGDEREVFENYPWTIYPRFMNIEVHKTGNKYTLDDNKTFIRNLMEQHGYVTLASFDTNIRQGNNHTHEFHFIKNELQNTHT